MLQQLQTWFYWRSLRKALAKKGWTIVHLDPGAGRAGPIWAYSVGLWELAGAPELILFGHDEVWSNGPLSHAKQELCEGLVLEDGTLWKIEEFEGVWRRVHPIQIRDAEWFNCARRYRRERTGSEDFEAYQLFVPDEGGKYPWEEGFDEEFRHYQPELYLSTLQVGPHGRRLAAMDSV